jgi:hypothetical protein
LIEEGSRDDSVAMMERLCAGCMQAEAYRARRPVNMMGED